MAKLALGYSGEFSTSGFLISPAGSWKSVASARVNQPRTQLGEHATEKSCGALDPATSTMRLLRDL